VAVSSDGSYIAAGSSDRRLYLLNIKGEVLWRFNTSGKVMSVSIASNGSHIAAGSLDNKIYVFKITD